MRNTLISLYAESYVRFIPLLCLQSEYKAINIELMPPINIFYLVFLNNTKKLSVKSTSCGFTGDQGSLFPPVFCDYAKLSFILSIQIGDFNILV